MGSKRDSNVSFPKRTDLRSITRGAKRYSTTVTISDWLDLNRSEWLMMGEADIRNQRISYDTRWWLESRMRDNVTDPEHDTVIAVRLPLVGAEINSVDYTMVHIVATIPADCESEFCVPLPGYDPISNPPKGSTVCKEKRCGKNHLVLPDGFYVPKFNEELYRSVVGRRVMITMGPVYKEMDDE